MAPEVGAPSQAGAPRPPRAGAAGREWGAVVHLSQVRRRGAGRRSGLRLGGSRCSSPANPGNSAPGRSLERSFWATRRVDARPGPRGPSRPEREDRLPGPQRARRRAPLPVPFSARPSPVAAGFQSAAAASPAASAACAALVLSDSFVCPPSFSLFRTSLAAPTPSQPPSPPARGRPPRGGDTAIWSAITGRSFVSCSPWCLGSGEIMVLNC